MVTSSTVTPNALLPAKYDLALYRGDTAQWQFVFWNDAAHTDPYDLSSAVVKSELRDSSGGATVVVLGCTVTLPNTINAVLTPANSALLPRKGVWDLQFTWPDGTVRTMLFGTVNVIFDVTDSGATHP